MNKVIQQSNPKEVADRTIEFIISDETIDDAGDVMVAEGCDFSRFEKNPQFLGFHDSYEFPFGKVISWGIDTRKKQVWAKVYFPKTGELSTNQESIAEHAKKIDMMFWMYKNRLLNAVSIGFDTISDEMKNVSGKNVHFVNKWKLFEFSGVVLPMNENALQKMKLSENIKDKEMAELLETECKAWSQAKENNMDTEKKSEEQVIEEKKPEASMELSDEIVEKIAGKVIAKMIDFKTVKAGARLSRETREGLDKVAKCHDTIKEAHRMAIKAHKEAEEALLDLIEKDSRYVEENESDGGSTYKPNAEGNGYEEETTSKEKMVEFEIEK